MAIDRTRRRKPDQEYWDEQGATSPGRSFECGFCKRSFSSAQALGGHMNIHRRDKARLKQASMSETTHDLPSYSTPNQYRPSCTTTQSRPITGAQLDIQDDDVNEREILFYEELSMKDQTKSNMSSSQGSSSELDLELRLGLEPHGSSPIVATRKFF